MEDPFTIEEKDRALFDKISDRYATKDVVPSSSIARQYQLDAALNSILKQGNGLRILEFACGVGATVDYLKGRYECYLGIDYSQKLISLAKQMHANSPRTDFLTKNIKDVEAEDINFRPNLVLGIGALHHMTCMSDVFQALTRVAEPGSVFVAIEPSRVNPFVMLLRKMRMLFSKEYSSDQHFFSRREVKKLLESQGFLNIKISYQGFVTPPFAQVVLQPQIIFLPLSRLAIVIDKLLDRYLPGFIKFLGWNLIILAQFPDENVRAIF